VTSDYVRVVDSKSEFDDRGLITAVVQDDASDEILMVAHMNAESLAKTLQTGETWFWSRSRQELWHKGATSGAIQASLICAWIATATRCCAGQSEWAGLSHRRTLVLFPWRAGRRSGEVRRASEDA